MVGPGELGAIPHGLVPFARRELAWYLDRLPTDAFSDGQPLSLSLAERRPHGLPAAELADPTGPLRKWKEQAVVHAARPLASRRTKAPSAVEHKITGRATAAARAASLPLSMSARMLPPKPAPMMRAPKQPRTAQAFSTSASMCGVETS